MERINLGAVRPEYRTWWEVPLPQCPECGGDIVWFEAGYVPGTRKCMGAPIDPSAERPSYHADGGCGAFYRVTTQDGHVYLEEGP